MNMSRWSEDTTLRFVELYRENECLWNTKSLHYRNKQARQRSLLNIVNNMDIPGFDISEAKQKIKNLRSTYIQELAKIQKSSQPGSSTDGIYVPSIKWFVIMDGFIKTLQAKKITQPNFESPDDSNFNKPNSSGIVETYETYDELSDLPVPAMANPPVRKRAESIDPLAATHAAKKKLDAFSHRSSQIKEVTEAVRELRELNYAINDQPYGQDECDTFGKHVAAQLRKLSVEECLLAQQEIQNLLTNYRIRDYRKTNTLLSLGQESMNATPSFETLNYTPKLATFSPQSAASSLEDNDVNDAVDVIPGTF